MTATLDPPPAKKPKVTGKIAGDVDHGDVVDDVLDTVWEHYRNYLDSESKADDGDHSPADTDELYELIEIGKQHFVDVPQCSNVEGTEDDSTMTNWKSRRTMLPILLSVAYNHLADAAIAEYLQQQQRDGRDPSSPCGAQEPTAAHHRSSSSTRGVQTLLLRSLEWYPHNAATWSMGANFARISQTLPMSTTRLWYERAVQSASRLRQRALTVLEEQDTPDDVKEWIELLVLNQVLGVEYEDDDDDDDENDDDENDDEDNDDDNYDDEVIAKTAKLQSTEQDTFRDEYDEKQEIEQEDGIRGEESFENEYGENEDMVKEEAEEGRGRYSSSAVEATARFMCAMLWSMAGSHDRALVHLKHFPLTHRLHPNVWNVSANSMKEISPPKGAPLAFRPSDGILPQGLYVAMTKLFSPDSAFWLESDYSNRGYFSFFMDYDETRVPRPRNLLEEVIVHHLLPRAQQVLDMAMEPSDESGHDEGASTPKICGFEWWAHTRAIQANLGHNLHFDTDESLLDQEGKVTHPILSSVLYLTGGETQSMESTNDSSRYSSSGGATIILDESPESEKVADKCWQGIPKDNSFLLFPGDRLHGVLPCPGGINSLGDDNSSFSSTETAATRTEILIQDWKNDLPESSSASSSAHSIPHRLTFMVGFWTRNVPATMKERRLYGPCGPLPPNTDEHTWVKELTKGYEDVNGTERPMAAKAMTATALPCVSPAWESFEPNVNVVMEDTKSGARTNRNDNEPPLLIPHSIDHRFFVRGAPHCFRQSLFEDREIDC